MAKLKLSFLTILLIAFFSLSAFVVDDGPFAQLIKKLQDYTKNYPTEKVHIHLDKPYYAIGDDIWFKAYVIDSRTSEPTSISNILYVELINENDSIKKKLKLEMKVGLTWGDFKLTDSLTEGNYRIRAYTQWMRNAGSQFFFDKTFKVGNSWANKVFTKTSYKSTPESTGERINTSIIFLDQNGKPYTNNEVDFDIQLNGKSISKGKATTTSTGEVRIAVLNTQPNVYKSGKIIATITLADGQKITKRVPINSTSSTIDVQFFPESGNLINGLPSKVAFKALNASGRGENISGKIVDNEGIEILDFESTYLGMGSFLLTPMVGKTYTAKINLANGASKSIQLPKQQDSGYSMSINASDSLKMGAKIFVSADLLNKGDLHLLAQHNGNVVFSTKVSTEKQITSLSIPKKELPSGIIVFTLFSSENIAVAERIAFSNNYSDKIIITEQNLKQSYTKRSNVNLDILASSIDKPTQGSFSVAVTNMSVVNPDPENETNILTSLLLTSDLVGYVEKPNHYFLSNDVNTRTQLDHLMLTQGWRKIDWVKINQSQLPIHSFEAEKNIKISGTITNNGKPVVKGKVSLLSSSNGIFVIDTLTDASGRFCFDQLSFNQGTRFAIKATSADNKNNVKITMDNVPDQLITVNKNKGDIEINVNESIKTYLAQSKDYFDEQEKSGFLERINVLNQVEIVSEKAKKAPNSSNFNGPGNADAVFNADDLKNSLSLSQFLNGRVAGVMIKNGIPSNTRNGNNMSVFVDGVLYISSMDSSVSGNLDNLTLLDIESVEILKSIALTFIYGHVGSEGVMLITTKTGKSRTISTANAPGMLSYSPKGYYAIRKFYSPQYTSTEDPKPDLRTTVYWNPHLVTDANGKATINFFNTDLTGNYRILIEGIDAFGNLARKTLTYQVK